MLSFLAMLMVVAVFVGPAATTEAFARVEPCSPAMCCASAATTTALSMGLIDDLKL